MAQQLHFDVLLPPSDENGISKLFKGLGKATLFGLMILMIDETYSVAAALLVLAVVVFFVFFLSVQNGVSLIKDFQICPRYL